MDFDLTTVESIATILGSVIAAVTLALAIWWRRSKAKKKEDGDRQNQEIPGSQNTQYTATNMTVINISNGNSDTSEAIKSLLKPPAQEQTPIPLQIDETVSNRKQRNQQDETSEFLESDFTIGSALEQIRQLSEYESKDTAEQLICMRKEWQDGNKSKAMQWLKGLRNGKWPLLSPEVKADVLIFEAEIELKENGNIRRARELADKAQSLMPSQNQNRIRALIAYHEEGPEEAIKVLDNQDDIDIDSLNLKADFLIELGRVEEALEILNFGNKSNDDT